MRSTRRGTQRRWGCFILVLILVAGVIGGVGWYITDSLQCGGWPSSECNRSADASKGEKLRIIGAPGGSVNWTVTGIESINGDWRPEDDVSLGLYNQSGTALQQTLRPTLEGASDWNDSISTGENDTSQMIIKGTIVVPHVPNGVTVLHGILSGTIDYPASSACGDFQAASACFQNETWDMSVPVELRIFSPQQLSDMTGGPVWPVLKVIGEVVVISLLLVAVILVSVSGGLSRRR